MIFGPARKVIVGAGGGGAGCTGGAALGAAATLFLQPTNPKAAITHRKYTPLRQLRFFIFVFLSSDAG
jgi:hypothetical protein